MSKTKTSKGGQSAPALETWWQPWPFTGAALANLDFQTMAIRDTPKGVLMTDGCFICTVERAPKSKMLKSTSFKVNEWPTSGLCKHFQRRLEVQYKPIQLPQVTLVTTKHSRQAHAVDAFLNPSAVPSLVYVLLGYTKDTPDPYPLVVGLDYFSIIMHGVDHPEIMYCEDAAVTDAHVLRFRTADGASLFLMNTRVAGSDSLVPLQFTDKFKGVIVQ